VKLKIGGHLCLTIQTFSTALRASPSWHAEAKTKAETGLKHLGFNVTVL